MFTNISYHSYNLIPKIELHLHLEGAIPHYALWELCQKYGGDAAVPSLEALVKRFEYIDFPHFIQTWVWKNQFLREYEDFTFIAEHVARELASQNILYAEVFYSPPDFFRFGLETQKITEAIRLGLSRVPEIEIALVPDVVRDFGPQKAMQTLKEIEEVKDMGVIGIGLGGSEHDYPPEAFESVFEEARCLGFHTSAHAGEAAGAESIWGAIRCLKPDRIGHGTRAFEDEALLDYLVEHQIPLEVCPISNVCTGVVSRIEDHPVRDYFRRGILVTINTDDPTMFNDSMAKEYQTLGESLGFSLADIRKLVNNAVQACWLNEPKKLQLSQRINDDPAWDMDPNPQT
ncbi:MAG: adenosine deaminase [Anaerolineales bacterium]|nr:adenosine deaminase [Anaerolineales bacterium]